MVKGLSVPEPTKGGGRLIVGLVALGIALGIVATLVSAAPANTGGKPREKLNKRDGQLAARLALRLSDFPAGWRVYTDTNKGGSKCGQPPTPASLIVTGKAKSEFASGQTNLAFSLVGVAQTVQQSKLTYSVVARFLPACLKTATASVGKNASVGAMSFPRFGDQSAAWETTTTLSKNGLSVDIYFDAIAIRLRRAVALYLFGGISPANTQQEVSLVRRAFTRA